MIKDSIFMLYGAWIHEHGLELTEQIALARSQEIKSVRSYSVDYSTRVASLLRDNDMSLLAGIHVDGKSLTHNWRDQIHLDELASTCRLDVNLAGICVGNEIREGGDEPERKIFTARLSFGLANLLDFYRLWLNDHGYNIPLTYAMEGIVFDQDGTFYEWIWPLIDACDIVSVNLYPMGVPEWFTFGAFEESRRFLTDENVRHDRLAQFEIQLRRILNQLGSVGKQMMFSESGFPSAVGYKIENERMVVPESDNERYGSAMREFLERIKRINFEYQNQIKALYFYEWRDNLYHSKIWNVEDSPIHVAFGLCDRFGNPKFDIKKTLEEVNS